MPLEPLEIDLALDSPDLVVGESAVARLRLRNSGTSVLNIPDPERSAQYPVLIARPLGPGSPRAMGRFARELAESHDFIPQLPPEIIELDPGATVVVELDLLKWLGTIPPGQYELVAIHHSGTAEVTSAPVPFTVEPLALSSCAIAGSQLGPEPTRYLLVSHQRGSGARLLLCLLGVDEHGHPQLLLTRRLADVASPAHAALSAAPPGQPYPGHWVVWPNDNALEGLYEKQARVELSPRVLAPFPAGARVVEPLVLDLEGCDGSRPARAHLAATLAGPTPGLQLHTIEPDAAVQQLGARVDLEPGTRAWARMSAFQGGRYAVVSAIQAGPKEEVVLQLVRWTHGNPPQRAQEWGRFPGRLVAADAAVDREDALHVRALIKERDATGEPHYRVVGFTVRADGQGAPAPVRSVAGPMALELTALGNRSGWLAVSHEHGDEAEVAGVIRADSGEWYLLGPTGALARLDLRACGVPPGAEPVALAWPSRALPILVCAGAATGLTFHRLGA